MTTDPRSQSLDPGGRAAFAEPPVVLCDEPGFFMGMWKNVRVVVWGVQATLPLARKLETLSDAQAADHPKGISAIHVIINGASLPDAETRAELNRLTDKYAKDLACMATVIEGSGFWASAIHSFITSLHWVARRPFKVRISSNFPEIASWLPTIHWERTGVRLESADLLRFLTWARGSLK